MWCLGERLFCTKCGTQLPDGARFCSRCGNPVGREDIHRSIGDRLWEGYKEILVGGTILMLVLLPVCIVGMLTDRPEPIFIAAFVIMPILLWWVLSKREGPQRRK